MTNQNYRRGADFERKVRDELYTKGAVLVVRAAGSHTKADLVAFFPKINSSSCVWIIQCKRDGKISRDEREQLVEISRKTGISSYLARSTDAGIEIKEITL